MDERTLEEVTLDLGSDYDEWKKYEKAKNRSKDEFFALATAASTEREAVEILVQIEAGSEDAAIRIAERYNPRYAFDAIRLEEETGPYDIIMVERPEYMPFLYINVEDGKVYQRQVVDGPQLLDDERLLAENPQLHEEVTFALPWGDRVVRPFDTLDPVYLGLISAYIYRGKPTVKLAAPRPASEEELESVGT